MLARRAWVLLQGDVGVTGAYAEAAIEADLVDAEELRAVRTRRGVRWYLA